MSRRASVLKASSQHEVSLHSLRTQPFFYRQRTPAGREIALEYLYRTRAHYHALVWLHAPTGWELAQNIVQALNTFGMSLAGYDDEGIFALFRAWLRRQPSPFLLVLDHLRADSLLNDVLEEQMEGHVLVTKSTHLVTDELKTMIVKPFTDAEGPHFLLHRAGLLAHHQPDEHASSALHKGAFALHEEFGGHPLALDQAGAYLSETGMSPAEYLRLYRKDRRAWLDRRGTASASYPFTAFTVIAAMRQGSAYSSDDLLWLYLDDRLDCSDPAPRLPSRGVPATLRQMADQHPSILFDLRVGLLQNFVLIPLEAPRGAWGIHPLVRTVLRDVRAAEREQDRRNREQEERYEPLTEEEVFEILVTVHQLRSQWATMPQESAEMSKLAHESAKAVMRLERAVVPAPRKQRERAKKRMEHRYSTLVWDVSEEQVRRYAREFFAMMQYRSGEEKEERK
jgi:hypothetical protein